MNRIFYAEKDTTLYEKHKTRNTGIDEILQLVKITCGSRHEGNIQTNTYNSRILIDFGTEITSITNAITAGDIPAINDRNIASASVFLNLHASEASDLLQSYTIDAYPISESWNNGGGYYSDSPENRIGSSWLHTSGDDVAGTGIAWQTGSAHSYNTSAGTTITKGGGTWITGSGYEASQSFKNTTPDLRIDVSNIVNNWVSSSDSQITNNGFIIKRPYADEVDMNVYGTINFFSRESHTIFVPRLEVCWDDVTPGTGNVEVNTISTNTYVPYIKNIKSEYRTNEIARFWVGVRPEFPTKTYQTSSFYMTTDRLPVSSSYSIYDSVTNDVIIKDEDSWGNSTTKMASHASDGNYFDLRMDSFMPERYYKIRLKCIRTNDTQTFDDFYFKVVN